jgi:hypothetical protein
MAKAKIKIRSIGCIIAVRNMIAFATHFMNHKIMTKKQFFDLQKEVFNRILKETKNESKY